MKNLELPTAEVSEISPEDREYLRSASEREQQLPLEVEPNTTLRVKIGDRCGLTCTFCHNEGTLVASDYKDEETGVDGRLPILDRPGKSGRVSVYSQTSGVDFLPGVMQPDQEFTESITTLGETLGLDELHITGGEPTLHPNVDKLIKIGTDQGFTVKMTSNGERFHRIAADCAEAGLSAVNFSIFGTTADELAQVQHERFQSIPLAEAKIEALHQSILAAHENGVKARANIVIPSSDHAERVYRLMDEFGDKLDLRLLNSLEDGEQSYLAIYRILDRLNATPVSHNVTAGSSNSRTTYKLPDGQSIKFKKIRKVHLPETCGDCQFKQDNSCEEGFYGVRLYVDTDETYRAGVCIQRMDLTLPLDEFMNSDYPEEIAQLNQRDRRELETSIGLVTLQSNSRA